MASATQARLQKMQVDDTDSMAAIVIIGVAAMLIGISAFFPQDTAARNGFVHSRPFTDSVIVTSGDPVETEYESYKVLTDNQPTCPKLNSCTLKPHVQPLSRGGISLLVVGSLSFSLMGFYAAMSPHVRTGVTNSRLALTAGYSSIVLIILTFVILTTNRKERSPEADEPVAITTDDQKNENRSAEKVANKTAKRIKKYGDETRKAVGGQLDNAEAEEEAAKKTDDRLEKYQRIVTD